MDLLLVKAVSPVLNDCLIHVILFQSLRTDSSLLTSTGGGGGGGYATTGATTGVGDFASDAVDECGLRFLILLRHHTTILKSLTPKQRASMEQAVSRIYIFKMHVIVVVLLNRHLLVLDGGCECPDRGLNFPRMSKFM